MMQPYELGIESTSWWDIFFLFTEVVGILIGIIAIIFVLGARKTFSEGAIGKTLDLVLFGVIFVVGSLFLTVAFSKVGATPFLLSAELVRELQSLLTTIGMFFFIGAAYSFYRIAVRYYT